nr:MAG TPA: hypothetical protein [Caudoviricetes sp.]
MELHDALLYDYYSCSYISSDDHLVVLERRNLTGNA